MEKSKVYKRTRFTAEALSAALLAWKRSLPEPEMAARVLSRSVSFGDERWRYDSDEEFLADISKGASSYTYQASAADQSFYISFLLNESSASVGAPTRPPIERVFQVFDRHAPHCLLPEADKQETSPTIFIGHGRDDDWRDLKDHLHEQHGYDIEAYEIGARAGHAIRDILDDMLQESSFALLVFTGEDLDEQGRHRARQNVVHELGLFQGSLGFSRAIVLLEQGTEEFSNIHGIHQIRFSKGNIRETFGDVLAVLRREFGSP